ncbi:MAG: EAL domain-containing protein [Rhodocyclaceae bacterium]|nr:EAL domain-containing protein [Rhodocyclaceae bacterium]
MSLVASWIPERSIERLPVGASATEPAIALATDALGELLDKDLLTVHFQPIADLAERRVALYEALMRGPGSHPLARPDALLEAATRSGRRSLLEQHAVRCAMRAFVAQALPGRLAVNLSASVLQALVADSATKLKALLRREGFDPTRLVIELTEDERVEDIDRLAGDLGTVRQMGVGLAIDDFGDGRSSLRLWAQLEPAFVKLDRYFVQGVHRDPRKLEVLRAVLRLAEAFNTALVGEGVELPGELAVMQELGVRFIQGYLCSMPVTQPAPRLADDFIRLLEVRTVPVMPSLDPSAGIANSLMQLVRIVPTVDVATDAAALAEVFHARESLYAVAVVDEHQVPVGLINRESFLDQYARPYFRELFGRRSCTRFMDPQPRIMDCETPIDRLTEVLTQANQRYLRDGLIVTRAGSYLGLVSPDDLVRSVTERRIESARHANPLTCLPGNIPITEHLRRLIRRGGQFAVAYCDLSNFKPYNDLYGYWRGDEMIILASRILIEEADPALDFIGHVGGDDFIAIFQSEDWLRRCLMMRDTFNRRALGLFDAAERDSGCMVGEDRRGNAMSFPLTRMVIGAVKVVPGQVRSAESIASDAARAKQRAKSAPDGFHVMAADEQIP